MTSILGVAVDNVVMTEAVDAVVSRLKNGPPCFIAFVNANSVNVAFENPEFRQVLKRADFRFADGIGMRLAGRWLGRPLREDVNGTDMFPMLCARLEGSGHRVFLLGARPGMAERVEQWIETHYPGVVVCGTRDGYFTEQATPQVIQSITAAKSDLLLVALGTPTQELWIARHLLHTGARVAIGVGGLFDFFGGRVRRAPRWVQSIEMEWLYRMLKEPQRLWRRYLIGNPLFLWRLLRGRRAS